MTEDRDYDREFAQECARLGISPDAISNALSSVPGEYPWLTSEDWVLSVLETIPNGAGPTTVTARLAAELARLRESGGGSSVTEPS